MVPGLCVTCVTVPPLPGAHLHNWSISACPSAVTAPALANGTPADVTQTEAPNAQHSEACATTQDVTWAAAAPPTWPQEETDTARSPQTVWEMQDLKQSRPQSSHLDA